MIKFLNKPLWHRLFLFITVVVFYGNTIENGFVLDDVLVIKSNDYVQRGIKGIPDIIFHDSFYGSTKKIANLPGGRYRPLSLVSFAVERDIFGNNPAVYHFFNILFYALLVLLIYQFLTMHVFRDNKLFPLGAALLFAILPVHTEVVANIKSRDEIYSLIFFISCLHLLIGFLKTGKKLKLIFSVLAFFLALLSKENGIILIVLIPLTIYFYSDEEIKKIPKLAMPFWIVTAAYILLRYSGNKLVNPEINDVMNDPYLLTSTAQKFATIAWVLMQYIRLVFYPAPLIFDYSYNQVAYVNFSNLQTIFSIVVYGIMIAFGFYSLIKKDIAGYFIICYLTSIFLISNILVNITSPMAERFLFGPSLFFIVALTIIFKRFIQRLNKSIIRVVPFILIVIYILSFNIVYGRNKDWKSNYSLYFKDIQFAGKSVRALSFCGITLVSMCDSMQDSLQRIKMLNEAIGYFNSAHGIYSDYGKMYQDWGSAYFYLNNIDSAEWAWNIYKALNPDNDFSQNNDAMISKFYYNKFINLYRENQKRNDYKEMLNNLREAVRHYDKAPDGWLYLGNLYQINNKTDSAIFALKKCLELQPDNEQAKELIKEYSK